MEKLIPFTISDLAKLTSHRSGEVKFGEKMITIPKEENKIEFLKKSDAKYVLLESPKMWAFVPILVVQEQPLRGKVPLTVLPIFNTIDFAKEVKSLFWAHWMYPKKWRKPKIWTFI